MSGTDAQSDGAFVSSSLMIDQPVEAQRPIGQLGVKAGLEESWVTITLHQAQDLILSQLERHRVNTDTQALIG